MNDDRSFVISLWSARFPQPIPDMSFVDRWADYGLNHTELIYIFNSVKTFQKEHAIDNAKILLSLIKKCARTRSKNYRG